MRHSFPASLLRRLRVRYSKFRGLATAIGVIAALRYIYCVEFRSKETDWKIHPRKSSHPLLIRAGTSDIDVFRQIFIEGEYFCLTGLQDVGLVVDCGANVGYSSLYFLSCFPNCEVIAIEPDPVNFKALEKNLEPYIANHRVNILQAAVWSHTERLVISRERFRDGRDWTRQVRPASESEQEYIEGIGIDAILADSMHDRISLLKIDIEGAEAVVFRSNYKNWLPKVDAIAIELHDDSNFGVATDVFFTAISNEGFDVDRSGELTICIRRGSSTS